MTRRPAHRLLALAGVAALTVSLAACSSDDGDEATTDDTATEDAAEETDSDAAGSGDFPEGSTMAELAAAGLLLGTILLVLLNRYDELPLL